jgi:3-deoxy-manno-octulosonate cytidylyltransferase (CMP-KDO synthetase)
MKYAVIIPARYESSRLPGKPLIDLDGVPMVVRTWRQCIKECPMDRVYVATDHERIKTVCEHFGIQVVMTSPNCLTGTDRVAECAISIDADVFINVQGDEPIFNPNDITELIKSSLQYPGEVINGYCEITDEKQFRSSSIPKVVIRMDGRLLYMSRVGIPTSKTHEYIKGWRQVCAYAFPRSALVAFASSPKKTMLEEIEDIEILRFLELGFEVRMIRMSQDSIAVDLPEDVEKVLDAIRGRKP